MSAATVKRPTAASRYWQPLTIGYAEFRRNVIKRADRCDVKLRQLAPLLRAVFSSNSRGRSKQIPPGMAINRRPANRFGAGLGCRTVQLSFGTHGRNYSDFLGDRAPVAMAPAAALQRL